MTGALTLDQAVDLTRSGDIWIFRGSRAPDRVIRTFTNAPVNHVGMSVVVDDLPPLIWHAELGRTQVDVWTGGHHRGTQLHDLRTAVERWQTEYDNAGPPRPRRSAPRSSRRPTRRWGCSPTTGERPGTTRAASGAATTCRSPHCGSSAARWP